MCNANWLRTFQCPNDQKSVLQEESLLNYENIHLKNSPSTVKSAGGFSYAII